MILTDEEVGMLSVFPGLTHIHTLVLVDHIRAVESALLEKLRGGVELPEPKYKVMAVLSRGLEDVFTSGQLIQYGAAQRLAGRERAIEECAAECLVLHANGNYKHDTREDCHDAIRALAASPQEQQP